MKAKHEMHSLNIANMQGRLKKFSLPVLAFLFIFLPVVMYGMITLIYYIKTGVASPMPQWNDEAAYYALVKTWLSTGMPYGYWGFEGSHAIVGTGSAWSPAILFPYALFGMMFGWNYSSVAIANVVFLCIVNALILLPLKPEKKELLYLYLVELLSGHIWLYMNTIMSEVLRYGLAMLLAVMLYKLLFDDMGKVMKYAIIPIYLLAVIQVYIFFAFAVPIYVFALMKNSKKKWYIKLVAAFLVMAVVAFSSYYLLHLISSNYNIYKTEMLLEAVKQKDILGALRTFLWMFKVGVLDLYSCFLRPVGYGMFHWFVPFLALLVILPLIVMGVNWKKTGKNTFWTSDNQILLMSAYSVALFTVMYITVYSLEAFTFYRGVGIAVLFVLVLLSQMDNRKVFVICILCYAIGLWFVPKNMPDFNTERYLTVEERNEWDELAQRLESSIYVKESKTVETDTMTALEANRWANTAVLYTMEPKLICAMPAGLGVNFAMYSEEIITDAEYLVFSLEEENELRPDWLEQSHEKLFKDNMDILQNDYFIQYYDEDYVIYQKQDR